MRLLIFCDECKNIAILEPKHKKINRNSFDYFVLQDEDIPIKEDDIKVYSSQVVTGDGIECIPYCISFKCSNCGKDGLMIYYNEDTAKRQGI